MDFLFQPNAFYIIIFFSSIIIYKILADIKIQKYNFRGTESE